MNYDSTIPFYGISGLGAEEHIFDRVNTHLSHRIEIVDWVPHEPSDDLERYALRLLETMDTSRPFYLLGLSFGGMLAAEMCKHVTPMKTILVSSAACRHESPSLYRGAGRIGLLSLIPNAFMTSSAKVVNHALRLGNPRFRAMPHRVIDKPMATWMKWASTSITKWQNEQAPENVLRIHGDRDLILPRCAQADYTIVNGSHFIITECAEEVAGIIDKELFLNEATETVIDRLVT